MWLGRRDWKRNIIFRHTRERKVYPAQRTHVRARFETKVRELYAPAQPHHSSLQGSINPCAFSRIGDDF